MLVVALAAPAAGQDPYAREVAIGVAMVAGHMTAFSLWLLQSFPAPGRIG